MAKHSYAADSVWTSIVWGVIAFISAVSALLAQPAFAFWIDALGLKEVSKSYEWLGGTVSLTSFCSFYYALFEYFLWRYWSKIPSLNGTWVDFTLPNYRDWCYLLVMRIEQTWSDISIVIDVYYKDSITEKWSPLPKKLGTDDSVSATLSAVSNNEVDFTIVYNHEGERQGGIADGEITHPQPNFSGTILAKVDLAAKRYKMTGKLYTNRYDSSSRSFGTVGKLALARISKYQMDATKAVTIAKSQKIFRQLESEVLSR